MKSRLLIVCLLFLITKSFAQEIEKYELKKIQFNGNNYFSSSTLSDVIFSRESPAWLWKFLNSFSSLGKEPIYFDSLIIQDDIRSLNEYYNNNGFFRTNITYNYEIDTAAKSVSLNYNIVEGPFSLFDNTVIIGLEKISNEFLSEIYQELSIDSTKRYQQTLVKENIDGILAYLQNNGYMLVRFDSTVIYRDTIVNTADVFIYFSTKDRYYIKDMIIEKNGIGSSSVDDELLKELVGIKDGEFYNLEKNRQSQIRLFRTGLFNSVSVAPSYQDTNGIYVPLKILGNIGTLNDLGPELLMNNQQNTFNLGLGLSYIRKNFLGNARKLSLSGSFGIQDIFNADLSNLFQKFSINDSSLYGFAETRMRIEQPYVFNRPIFGILEGYFSIRKDNLLRSRLFGGKISFEFEMPNYTFVSYLTTYYNLEVVDVTLNLSKYLSSSQLKTFQFNNTLSVIGTDIRSSKVDNPLFPATGYNLSMIIEDANFFPFLLSELLNKDYNHTSFYKMLVTFSWYILSNKKKASVFAAKFKAGYIQSYYGNSFEIPETRKFFSGGSNSIRGWRARELRPEKNFVNNSVIYQSYGGNFLFEASFEFRRKFSEVMGFTIFGDFGNTWDGYKTFRFDQVAIANGLGLRYYTAFAPFRVDFGIKTYDPNNKKSLFRKRFFEVLEFHFGIGEAF